MLGTQEAQLSNPQNTGLSFAASAILMVGAFYVAIEAGKRAVDLAEQKPTDVTFVEEIEKPEPKPAPEPPPPAPPPKAEPKPEPPPAEAQVVPDHVKKKIVKKPVKLKKLAAPVKIDKGPLEEADPSQEKGVAVYAGAKESIEATGSGGPVQELPEAASPPLPRSGNPMPEFPAVAKAEGLSGMVILKLIIDEAGRVAEIRVLRGEDPFVEPAVEAVRNWRYDPATQGGRAIRVFHIVKIPFTMET